MLAAVAAWGAVAAWLLTSRIDHIPSEELVSLDPAGPGPTNYLLVGSDSRENLTPELGGFFGDFGGERADVIIVFHAAGGGVQMLSIPRDLKVDIPGHGTDRVNAAYAFGGPDLLVQVVKSATGLPIHHYIEVGFAEFADVVDGLGGVSISFPYEARDNKSGLAVAAGTEHLDGPQALAYVRSRSYEELQGGGWVAVDQGDIARTTRQQQVLYQLLDRAISPARFFTLPWLAGSVGESIAADEGLSLTDLIAIGWRLAWTDGIESATLPVRDASEGGVSYLAPRDPEASQVLGAFSRGEALPGLEG